MIEVDANDVPRCPNLCCGEPSDNTSTAGDIRDTLARLDGSTGEEIVRPWSKESWDHVAFIRLRRITI